MHNIIGQELGEFILLVSKLDEIDVKIIILHSESWK